MKEGERGEEREKGEGERRTVFAVKDGERKEGIKDREKSKRCMG